MKREKEFKLNFNYQIAAFVSMINLGMIRKLRFIEMPRTIIAIRLLRILYREGVIRTFVVRYGYISVYFKYVDSKLLCTKLELVSRPSKPCHWNLTDLAKKFNKHNFTGFYIISTTRGFITSDYCLLQGHLSGKILIKVELT